MCKRRSYVVSRIIFYLHYGFWPLGVIDHVNGDTRDDRPKNLRDLSPQQNSKSYQKSREGSASVYRGVYKSRDRWAAGINCNYIKYYCGSFDCEKEASLAYNYKAMELGFNKEAFNKVFT
jgi:hypothetical protein